MQPTRTEKPPRLTELHEFPSKYFKTIRFIKFTTPHTEKNILSTGLTSHMRILIHSNRFIDFEAPIALRPHQKEAFIRFMTELFSGEVEIKNVAEPYRFVTKTEGQIKKWTADDYFVLLKVPDNNAAAIQLKRSEMSVRMKRGEFIPAFLKWAKEHKKDFLSFESVKEFLEAQNV
jgi:hypothetical protein